MCFDLKILKSLADATHPTTMPKIPRTRRTSSPLGRRSPAVADSPAPSRRSPAVPPRHTGRLSAARTKIARRSPSVPASPASITGRRSPPVLEGSRPASTGRRSPPVPVPPRRSPRVPAGPASFTSSSAPMTGHQTPPSPGVAATSRDAVELDVANPVEAVCWTQVWYIHRLSLSASDTSTGRSSPKDRPHISRRRLSYQARR